MGRPKKPVEDTRRGKLAIKSAQKEEERIRKQQLKQENIQLAAQGLVRDTDGEIGSFSDISKKNFQNASHESKEAMINAGKYWHREVASEAQQTDQKEHGSAWFAGKATLEEQREVGAAGRDWFHEVATPEEQEHVRDVGRHAWGNLVGEALQVALDAQERGREVETANRAAAADVRHNTPGAPLLTTDRDVWSCVGPSQECSFSCLDNLSGNCFFDIPELVIMIWIIAHQLMDNKCEKCPGYCSAIALEDRLGLRCDTCHTISRGGFRSFWAKGHLGISKMMALVWGIVEGFSYQLLTKIKIPCNKNTFTSFVKDVGLVCAEALERNRRDPNSRYLHAQADETAFGRRKYRKGKRVRKRGVQWGLTILHYDPSARPRKALNVDLQFLPGNKRTIETLTPPIVQRMLPGGTLTTDGWRAYEEAARVAGVTHIVVNHKKEWVTIEGENTNGAEGIHSVVKKDARSQFGRLPYLTADGRTYYLDLLIWRANARLSADGPVNLFRAFCWELIMWTHNPLVDFDHTILPFHDDEEDEDDDDIFDTGEHDDWFIDPADISDNDDTEDDPDWEDH